MLKTLFTPFISPSSAQKQTAAMMVTSHDINFVMGFIKEEEMFSSSNASMSTLPPTTISVSNVSEMNEHFKHFPTGFHRRDLIYANESNRSINEHTRECFSIKNG